MFISVLTCLSAALFHHAHSLQPHRMVLDDDLVSLLWIPVSMQQELSLKYPSCHVGRHSEALCTAWGQSDKKQVCLVVSTRERSQSFLIQVDPK